ncbi:MAG: 30S ribosomal protein S3ae [Promethearchaeota archaeon]
MSQKLKKSKKKKPKAKKVSYKDKNWYTVIAPKNFNYQELGDIIGTEKNVVGRTVEVLLYDFTNDFNDINLKLKFKIIDVNEEAKKCNSIFIGHSYTTDYIRSIVGRGVSKITSILNSTTKDGYVFRVTIVCVTIRRARSSQQILIRKIMSEIIKEFAKSLNHEKFINGIIRGEFENQITRVVKTIYPISSCTVIKSKLISIPEGGKDKEVPDNVYDVVEIEVKRSRKSEIRRTERINVKKIAEAAAKPEKEEKETEEEVLEEKLEEVEE